MKSEKNKKYAKKYPPKELKRPILTGYACMNLDIYPNSYKTCRIQNINDERLKEIISHNISVLEATIDYNIANKNLMYRVSSSLIPYASNHDVIKIDWKKIYKRDFDRIKSKIEQSGIRISCHPGQYTVLNSPNENVVKSSIRELEYHTDLMNLLSGTQNHKMILHIGGEYKNKKEAMERFIKVYKTLLSKDIKKYLVIENDDKIYNVEEILYISDATGCPVVFDNLHHEVNPSLKGLSLKEIFEKVISTWKPLDGRPKMHYSQQDIGKRKGAHSETIFLDRFQNDLGEILESFEVDIMLEVKDKNRSFIKTDLFLNPDRKTLEKEWARYKYWVMSKSQKAYNEIRSLFRNNKELSVFEFYSVIDNLRAEPFSLKDESNTLLHIWGYFKNIALLKEKEFFFKNYELFGEGEIKKEKIINIFKI